MPAVLCLLRNFVSCIFPPIKDAEIPHEKNSWKILQANVVEWTVKRVGDPG